MISPVLKAQDVDIHCLERCFPTNDTNIIQYIPMCQDNPRIQDKENEGMSEPNGPMGLCQIALMDRPVIQPEAMRQTNLTESRLLFEDVRSDLRQILSKL